MNIRIIPKQDWSQAQKEQIQYHREDPVHHDDSGPIKVDYERGMYAAAFEDGEVFGICEASGPLDAVNPGWWIAAKYRGQGLGKCMVVALARLLRKEDYTGASRILVQSTHGEYDAASEKLKQVFIKAFNHEGDGT